MRLLWTKSGLPLSVGIRWGLGEPSSHFVVVFNDCLLFQSNLLGTGLDYYPYFIKNEAQVVHEMEIPLSPEVESKIYDQILMNFSHRYYDFGALLFFIYRGLLRKFFKIPLPKRNLWGDSDTFLCVGVAKCLDIDGVPEWLRKSIRDVPDLEMISPEDMFNRMTKAVSLGPV